MRMELMNGDNVNAADTPMTAGLKLSKADCPTPELAATMVTEQKWYLWVVASLIYVMTWTRPDIAYALGTLCRFMHNPGKPHITALKHLLRYMHGTRGWGLKYSPLTDSKRRGVYGLYDASHADSSLIALILVDRRWPTYFIFLVVLSLGIQNYIRMSPSAPTNLNIVVPQKQQEKQNG
mgnify:CR=1 FL=1